MDNKFRIIYYVPKIFVIEVIQYIIMSIARIILKIGNVCG